MTYDPSLFGGEQAEMYNAVMKALYDCTNDLRQPFDTPVTKEDVYEYIESCPLTSLVAEVVNKLVENGFQISKK